MRTTWLAALSAALLLAAALPAPAAADVRFLVDGQPLCAGARIALLDATARTAIEDLVRRVEKIETAIEPRFQAHFIEAMAIPHKTAAYPELRKVVTLPEAKESVAQGATRGRRGRRITTP